MDDARRRPHDHGFGRNPDSIWDDSSIGFDYADAARPPLPHYKGKKVDVSDLLRALDHVDLMLLEVSRLIDGISRRSDQVAPTDIFNSYRQTRVVTHERLGASLTITSTPSGQSVELKADPDQGSPYWLNNSAVHYSRHIQSLFNGAGWLPKRSNSYS